MAHQYTTMVLGWIDVVNNVQPCRCSANGMRRRSDVVVLSGSFIIQSDHKPLEKLLHEKNKLSHMAAPRIKRWSLDLSAYDYSWKYRSGKNMCHADAMSRLPLNDPERDEVVFLLQTLDYSPITSE